jgi:16S rRNA (cytosine1402-N4)-methyltransferase
MSHISVLQHEVVQAFDGVELRVFFDGTLGAGGHAEAILAAHPEIEKYIGCDRDPRAHELAGRRLVKFGKKVELVRGSYSDLDQLYEGEIDGFLIDIGVSSMQIDEKERGFSFRFDGPLDMRMDPDGDLTAAMIVNRWPEKELERIFREYGEERQARRAAEAIIKARKKRKIETTNELIEVVKPVLKWGKIHPATLIFQALRIAVNDELGELERGLKAAAKKLRPGGRLAVITFHSLEDRMVKHGLRADKTVKVLTKKPIVPSEAEIRANPRSRSAKLRVAEKC